MFFVASKTGVATRFLTLSFLTEKTSPTDAIHANVDAWAARLTLNDRVNHFALYVGQAEVTPGVAESQTFVIDPQKMQHGCVQIVRMDSVFGSQNAVFIGLAINEAASDATASHP